MVRLLDAIDRHRRGYAGKTHLIFLGDLVDRGPASAGVLEYLQVNKLPADDATFLMGNHEELMLDCYDGKIRSYAPWLKFGGLATLESYGVPAKEIFFSKSDLGAVMRDAIPQSHIAFVKTFQDTIRLGDFLFVHAGIRPGIPLEDQSTLDLRWIGSEFLADGRNHGYTVVHGHTISPEIVRRPNRIGVDTGCFRTGILTALVLEGDESGSLKTG